MKKINIHQIVTDNVMTVDEILKYIRSNFNIDLDLVDKVVLIRNFTTTKEIEDLYPNATKIYGLRSKSYYNSLNRTFIIATNEGANKIYQINLQVEILNYLTKRRVVVEVLKIHEESELFNKWFIRCQKFLIDAGIKDLSAIAVGSTYNFHFFIDRLFGHPVLNNLGNYFSKISRSGDFCKYLNYRLDSILLKTRG